MLGYNAPNDDVIDPSVELAETKPSIETYNAPNDDVIDPSVALAETEPLNETEQADYSLVSVVVGEGVLWYNASSRQAQNERAMYEKFRNVLHERIHVLVHLGGIQLSSRK